MKKVYFISGTMCTIDLWKLVFSRLKYTNFVHIDITSATSFSDVNKLIINAIDAPAIIVGFSLGGFSAMNFAVAYPEMVKKLVVIAANSDGLDQNEIQLRKSTIDFLEQHKYKGVSKHRIQQFLHPDNYQNENIISVIKKMDSDLGKKVLIRQLKATSSRVDISEHVSKLKVPVLFVSAENDALVSAESIKTTSKTLSKGRYVCIKNCGHMIPLEKFNELSDILNQFI